MRNIFSAYSLISYRLAITILLLITMTLVMADAFARAERKTANFNHNTTAFPLIGAHNKALCDNCHVGGLFKGTPTACAGCHTAGQRIAATFKSPNHIVTNAPCETCHTSMTSFDGAKFTHDRVRPKTCLTCHNATMATGKPMAHMVTSASCDSCHMKTAWLPARFDHTGVAPGSCGTCHGGQVPTAMTKTPEHIATVGGKACDACHSNGYNTFAGAKMNHNAVVSLSCVTCHNGAYTSQGAIGKNIGHVATTAACDTCHKSVTTFLSAVYDHTGVTAGTCGTCHGGQSATTVSKPSGHIPTTGNACDACHTKGYSSFAGATMSHTAVSATSCATCHNGAYTSQGTQGALAKPSGHVATTAACSNCHKNFTTFNGAVYDHTGVTPGTCGTCHGGQSATTVSKPSGHIPTTGNACDACHTKGYTSFAGPTMSHSVIGSTRCDTCHNGAYTSQGTQGARAKPNNHIPTTITGSLDCNTCHSGTTVWTSEKMNHNGATTGCKVCHNSSASYLGNMEKKTLGSHEGSTTANDCSQSGCHRPLGNEGTAYSKWD